MEANMGYIGFAMGLLLGIKCIFHALFQLFCVNWLVLT
jgi:hypothetical protein